MTRPRLLCVPIAAALEAERLMELVDWADVAAFDAPGAGAARDAEPRGVAGVVDAALEKLDDLGWESCCVVCDSHGQAAAIELTLAHPDRVSAIAIGHAAGTYRLSGPRPAMTPAIYSAAEQLLDTDYRTFGRAITQLTQGLATDEYIDAWIEAVPRDVARSILGDLSERQPGLVTKLKGTSLPIVLGQHRGCVMWTPEAFEDARRALPDARVVVCDGIPVHDPNFLEAIRDASVEAARAG